MAAHKTHPPGTVLGDKFRVERLLGAGGMGAVYEITHLVTQHRRALKLLHPETGTSEEAVTRFLREASAAGRIQSSHIVECFDAGLLPTGEPYLLLELLHGRSLSARLLGTAGLAPAEAIALVIQACEGAAAAHAAGIVHRDLKPDNLFLVERDAGTFVKLLDFGISRFERAGSLTHLTTRGAVVGTPHYMAPEQMRGEEEVDARTDVYALGVILWECLTNQLPYRVRDVVQLIAAVQSAHEPNLRELRNDLPDEIVTLVADAMKKRPADRIATAAELGERLRGLSIALPPVDTVSLADTCPLPELDSAVTNENSVAATPAADRLRPRENTTRAISKAADEHTRPAPRLRVGFAAAGATLMVVGAATWAFNANRTEAPPGGAAAEHSAGATSSARVAEPTASGAPPATAQTSAPAAASTPTAKSTPQRSALLGSASARPSGRIAGKDELDDE